jgi:RNA polymerase sigma-70 factor (ECF subfamily)
MNSDAEFEKIVDLYYASLYRFALSLSKQESDACDLTQETFYIWGTKRGQVRDQSKIKSWLFTTLHREFLRKKRRTTRFPELELEAAALELPPIDPASIARLDGQTVLAAFKEIDQSFLAPLALFYIEDYSYLEIAEILDIPLGTVKSRISRGIAQLQEVILDGEFAGKAKV